MKMCSKQNNSWPNSKRIDEAKNENKKLRDVQFGDFPLEQFSDAGKVANEGDPHLKAAADMEL